MFLRFIGRRSHVAMELTRYLSSNVWITRNRISEAFRKNSLCSFFSTQIAQLLRNSYLLSYAWKSNILNKDKYLENSNAIYSKLHDYCSVHTCIAIRGIVVTIIVPFCICRQTQQSCNFLYVCVQNPLFYKMLRLFWSFINVLATLRKENMVFARSSFEDIAKS